MSPHRLRVAVGFIVAPALGAIVSVLPLCAISSVSKEPSLASCGEAISFFSFYGMFIAYPAALVLGVPIFAFLKRKHFLRWWQVGFAGALAGLPLVFLLSSPMGIAFAPIFSLVGFVCGLVFWGLAVLKNPTLTNHSTRPTQKTAQAG